MPTIELIAILQNSLIQWTLNSLLCLAVCCACYVVLIVKDLLTELPQRPPELLVIPEAR